MKLQSSSFLSGDASREGRVRALLDRNTQTGAYGLRLTPQQAQALVAAQTEALDHAGRLEFGGGVLDRMACAFCTSPYFGPEDWEHALRTLTDLFYWFKNETRDRAGDKELLDWMRAAFDGPCHGSLELLAGLDPRELLEEGNG